MKQNLRRILMCAALAGLPIIHMNAYNWVPVGDNVDSNGFATTLGSYHSRDVLGDFAPNPTRNRSFTAHAGDFTLQVYGNLHTGNPNPNNPNASLVPGPIQASLKVNGNVILDATNHDMTINIREDVIIEPYFQPPTVPVFEQPFLSVPVSDCAQVYFNTGNGFTTTINVDHNLTFRGKTTASGFKDLLVTFRGRGTVIFNMADGTAVKFLGQVDTSSPQVLLDPETGLFSSLCDQQNPGAHDAAGTKVFVLMDQTKDDVDCGKNKVVFQRQSLNSGDNNQRVLIEVGTNSVFTYLSTNPTGLPSEEFSDGYGAVAFDPSNNGTGRMVLVLRGAYKLGREGVTQAECESDPLGNVCDLVVEKYPFNDGAVLINGHFVQAFDPETISGCVLPTETEALIAGYDFSRPAGIQAIWRVVDNQLFESIADYPGFPYNPSIDQRRGLLVVNDVINHGKLWSDPYWDLYTSIGAGFLGARFAPSNPDNNIFNTRRGFQLGVNGLIDIYHNTFMDHASGCSNVCDPVAECDFANPLFGGDAGLLKHRNPSALIVDGLDVGLFISGNPFVLDTLGNPSASLFDAANPYTQANPVHGIMQLRGSGTMYVRESGSTKFGYLYNLFTNNAPTPLGNVLLDWTNALGVGTGSYDGFNLSPNPDTKQSGEGEHVLDVEGPLEVRSVANNTAIDALTDCQPRNYKEFVENAGVFNAASVLIDYTGREVLTGDDDLVDRPLLNDGTVYARYNSPTLFFNNFAMFFNSIFRQSDATKFVDGIPNFSEPGITGSERNWFGVAFWGDTEANRIADPNRYRLPEIQLFNSTLELQESLNAGGVRFVVKDVPAEFLGSNQQDIPVGREGDNFSVIKFFDHGDTLDTQLTGFGRVFLIGTSLNLMCDGSNNYLTESGFVNVFKHNNADGFEFPLEEASRVTLSLQNGDQFSPDVQAAIDLVPSLREKQRAHHLFMFAQPTPLSIPQPCVCNPNVNMVIGWSDNLKIDDVVNGLQSPFGDSGAFPGSFPYSNEPLIPTTATFAGGGQVFISDPLNLDALINPPAVTSIDGSIICFGSFDQDGNSITVPVRGDNANGVIYVKHGGRITITRPDAFPIPGPGERESIPQQSVFSTMLAQRVWNDYNFDGNQRVIQLTGIVDLPHDQVKFDTNFGVQPYNFTVDMFAARRTETDGFVRLSFLNEERPVRLALGNNSGAEEVTIGWHFRDMLPFEIGTIPGTAGNIGPKSPRPVTGKPQRGPSTRKVAVMSEAMKWMTRATESVGAPVERPTDLLYIGAGDDITQMKIAGATMSDPFMLAISGDGIRPTSARVREFVSLKSTTGVIPDHFISEGAHAVLFLDFNGQIGLGSRDWNEHSDAAWNILGKDYVTICPLSDGLVNVNSNVIVADRLALIASTTFSQDEVNRLTFFSQEDLEIRIPAGGELDLSSFGQSPNRQEIAFAGRLRLVLEENATIRFPQNPDGGVVLYFNDNSSLIFEGEQVPNTFLPFTDAQNNLNNVPNDAPIKNSRIRILGEGQIWLNKNASMLVNEDVYVGVETDELTPITDFAISIQRQGAMFVGDNNVSGGTFQVGNPINRTTEEVNHRIDFSLLVNGPDAQVFIGREGFFGFAAGIMNKNSAPNGDATTANNPVLNPDGTAATIIVDGVVVPVFNPDTDPTSGQWQVQALHNVRSVVIQLDEAILQHSNIFDGSSNQASLMAFGPANNYTWRQGNQDQVNVRGGGNIISVPEAARPEADGPIFVNIWDYAGLVGNGESAETSFLYGASVLASGQLLLERREDFASSDYPNAGDPGKEFFFSNVDDLFSFLAFEPFNLQGTTYARRIDISNDPIYGFQGVYTTQNPAGKYGALPGAEIRRLEQRDLIDVGSIEEAVELGALQALADDVGITPVSFVTGR